MKPKKCKCGAMPRMHHEFDTSGEEKFYLYCQKCGNYILPRYLEKEAIEAWNDKLERARKK
jgi:hypothetical protein